MRSSARPYPETRQSGRIAVTLTVLFGLLLPEAAAAASMARVSITVQGPDGRPVPGAVVTAHALGTEVRPAAAVQAVMDQVNRKFEPDLLVIPVGSTVQFPNSDSVSHQIYSFSAAKRFQLPLYRGKPYPPEHFDQPGIVTLGCNIHDAMLAYLVVTDAPFFGQADASGTWSAEIPQGRYRVSVWHPRIKDDAVSLDRELLVGDGDRHTLTLRLTRPLRPPALEGRPHSWDAY